MGRPGRKSPKISKFFTPIIPQASSRGQIGFDNIRDNIDPHIKTQAISSQEGRYNSLEVKEPDDTFTQLMVFGRNGTNIGAIDNSSSNFRIKALNNKSLFLINDTNDGIEIVDGGVIRFVSGGGLCYGEIYVKDNATADTIATGTPTQVLRFDTNGQSNGTTPDHTNDHITIDNSGKYLVTISCSFSGTGSVNWQFDCYKNNGDTIFNNLHTDRKIGAAGDVGSISMSGIVDLTATDTLELWIQQDSGVNKDITVQDCTISIVQIGH